MTKIIRTSFSVKVTTNHFVILFAILTLLVSGCKCDEKHIDTGPILADLKIKIGEYDYYYTEDCFNVVDTFCIRSDSAYNAFFAIDSSEDGCTDVRLPYVDFNLYSVLGYRIYKSGAYRFHRKVSVDSSNKVVTYSITTPQCRCWDKCISYSMNMVMVPKIRDDYTVEFK